MPHSLLRSLVRVLTSLLITSVVFVPTIMRARQHIRLRDTTSLSIRLNWKSDAPPQKEFFVPTPQIRRTAEPIAVSAPPSAMHFASGLQSADTVVRRLAFENAPDLFRGPPPLSL